SSGCRAGAPLGVVLTQSQRYGPPRLREAAAGSLGSPPTTCDTPVPAPRRSARERPFPWTSPCTRSPSACSARSEEHTSELQSRFDLVCRRLLEKQKLNGPGTCTSVDAYERPKARGEPRGRARLD